jgi:hypothetical protein
MQENEMGESYGTYGRQERYIQGFVGRAEGKRPLGRPRGGWQDNIKTDQREVGWGGMDWTVVDQNRNRWRALVKAVMNLRVP